MTTDTVPAAATGLPTFALPPLPEIADARQLWSLHQAVHTIADVVDGLMSQPRFAATRNRVAYFNAAGEALSELSENLMEYADRLVALVRALPEGDGSGEDYRARLLLEQALASSETVAMAAEAIEDLRDGKARS